MKRERAHAVPPLSVFFFSSLPAWPLSPPPGPWPWPRFWRGRRLRPRRRQQQHRQRRWGWRSEVEGRKRERERVERRASRSTTAHKTDASSISLHPRVSTHRPVQAGGGQGGGGRVGGVVHGLVLSECVWCGAARDETTSFFRRSGRRPAFNALFLRALLGAFFSDARLPARDRPGEWGKVGPAPRLRACTCTPLPSFNPSLTFSRASSEGWRAAQGAPLLDALTLPSFKTSPLPPRPPPRCRP